MPLAGHRILSRRITKRLYEGGWTTAENLMKMVAIVLAESAGYEHAWNYNDPEDGGDGSVDLGLFMLNDGNRGGNPPHVDSTGKPYPSEGGIKSVAEREEFYAMALNATEAQVVARDLYVRRSFQPWAAYNNGAWERHIEQATIGLCNYFREKFGKPLL